MSSQRIRIIFLLSALLIVVAAVMYANRLTHNLADEERKRMEIWAAATREFIMAGPNDDISFVSSIIEGNTTIPVYMVDSEDNVLLTRNVRVPQTNTEAFFKKKINRLKSSQEPIQVRISDDIVQYIYYEDSTLLRSLQYFPYILFAIIFIFVLLAIYVLYTIQQNEQNRIWVGLSKETAHQLGTPISSLNAWHELLKARYPNDMLIDEMDKDVQRLATIADRFSKIGSEPELELTALLPVVEHSIEYMTNRTSQKVHYVFDNNINADCQVYLNQQLFEWVIENLCRNAIDAMEGAGQISISLYTNGSWAVVDVTDTGKGIASSATNRIFEAGYTTKKRGWGLGLSLSKRIIERYHNGKLTLARTELGKGSTFRIQLSTLTQS